MNKLTVLLLAFIIFSCNDDTKKAKNTPVEAQTEQTEQAETKVEIIKADKPDCMIPFFKNTKTPEGAGNEKLVKSFKALATNQASKSITITKNNIKETLEEAKKYRQAVIIVANHTVVKVLDYNNCKVSASWGACMPYVEGYIKKGSLQPQKDYANNIIGLPDAQERVMYLYN